MFHKLFKMLKRAFRRRQSGTVRAWCPDCWEYFNPYEGHHCVVIEALEIVYE